MCPKEGRLENDRDGGRGPGPIQRAEASAMSSQLRDRSAGIRVNACMEEMRTCNLIRSRWRFA